MSRNTLLTDLHERVRVITLNRPERMNAWTFEMAAELRAEITAANEDDGVDAIVITGAGKGFCAGADIEAVFAAQQSEAPPLRDAANTGDWVALVRRSKPIVAAINGAAIGVGLSQLMAMDRIIAADGATISFRFVRMGVVPELASSVLLVQRAGFGAASDLMLTGRDIKAAEALALGVIDEVTAPADLLPRALECARQMGSNSHLAVAETKALLSANMTEASLDQVQSREMAALARAYASPEHHEAIAAFLDKRAPDFAAARARQAGADDGGSA